MISEKAFCNNVSHACNIGNIAFTQLALYALHLQEYFLFFLVRPVAVVVKDIAIGAVGLVLDFQAGHTVTNCSPPL